MALIRDYHYFPKNSWREWVSALLQLENDANTLICVLTKMILVHDWPPVTVCYSSSGIAWYVKKGKTLAWCFGFFFFLIFPAPVSL